MILKYSYLVSCIFKFYDYLYSRKTHVLAFFRGNQRRNLSKLPEMLFFPDSFQWVFVKPGSFTIKLSNILTQFDLFEFFRGIFKSRISGALLTLRKILADLISYPWRQLFFPLETMELWLLILRNFLVTFSAKKILLWLITIPKFDWDALGLPRNRQSPKRTVQNTDTLCLIFNSHASLIVLK